MGIPHAIIMPTLVVGRGDLLLNNVSGRCASLRPSLSLAEALTRAASVRREPKSPYCFCAETACHTQLCGKEGQALATGLGQLLTFRTTTSCQALAQTSILNSDTVMAQHPADLDMGTGEIGAIHTLIDTLSL